MKAPILIVLALLLAMALVVSVVRVHPAHAQTATFLWTATGDDSTAGRAATDSLRYSRTPVGVDTLGWWRVANVVPNMPVPSLSGQTDSVTFAVQLYSTTYYAVLKVCDEAGNCSGWSNVASKTTGPPPADIIPPRRVTDLRGR